MKKIFLALLLITLVGCTNFKDNYDNTSIRNSIESYQLDLRIYGSYGNEAVNEIYKIDNFKNEKFKISTEENSYYLVDNKTYKSTNPLDYMNEEFEEVEESVFHDTDLILNGVNNTKSKKEVDNDINGIDYIVYEVTYSDKHIKDLLNKLNLNFDYKKVTGKIYLENDKIAKIKYNIDDLTIDGSFFRVNSVNESIFNVNIK